MADEGDRVPEPVALLGGEVGEQGEEVELVAAADESFRLEEQQDFGGGGRQAPGRLLDGVSHGQADARFLAQDPLVAGEPIDLELQGEALLGRRNAALGDRAAQLGRTRVDMGGMVETPASVPPLVVFTRLPGGIVSKQLPRRQMLEERALVLHEDGDVDVAVIAGLPAESAIDGPAAAEGPPAAEGGHEVRDAGDGLGYVVRRLA